jgi:hypothetical protein
MRHDRATNNAREANLLLDVHGRCFGTTRRRLSSLHCCNGQPYRQGFIVIEGLFQPMHLLVILGVALLMFGPKNFPN